MLWLKLTAPLCGLGLLILVVTSHNDKLVNDVMSGAVVGGGLGVIAMILYFIVQGIKTIVLFIKARTPAVQQGLANTVSVVVDDLKHRNKVCPHCAETIKAAATVCRYCHRDIPG